MRRTQWKSASAAVLFLLLALLPCGRAVGAEPFRLRVLCYNIHHAEGVDGKLALDRIAGVIRSVRPDVVALQEVDVNTRRTGKVDQAAELARLTEMKVVFGKNIDFEGGGYGNAVLSRLPIASHRNVHLPVVDDGEQRGVLVVELQPPSLDEPIHFLATHLDHRPDDRERLASARQINQMVQEHRTTPAILAGDLNATPDSRVLEVVREEWTSANDEPLPTIPVARPTRQIDFILVRPKDRWKVIEVRVLDEPVASDHRPIFAELELAPAKRKRQEGPEH